MLVKLSLNNSTSIVVNKKKIHNLKLVITTKFISINIKFFYFK